MKAWNWMGCDKMSDVAELRTKAAPYNPRKITDEQLERLGKSMAEYGDLSGIVVNAATGHVVGGHQRLKQLDPTWTVFKEPHTDQTGTTAIGHIDTPLGRWSYREVNWPEQKEKAANLAANKHGGDWDIPILKELLVELDDGAFDLNLTGFSEDELKDLIDWQGTEETKTEDEVAELPKKPKTNIGDLYRLENHRLLCGDSGSSKDVARLLGEKKPTVIFTDPPYGVSIGKKNAMLNTFQPSGRCLDDLAMDDMKPEELGKILLAVFSLWKKHIADDCSVFVCSPQGGGLGMMMMMMMKDAGLEVRHILNWIKNAPTFSMGRLDYDYAHEPILFTWKKTHKRKKEGAFQTSLWTVDKPMANKYHPTMKPVELPVCAILNHSDEGDVVADPFLGSGTTIIAAEQTKRSCFGMEISPAYCDVVVSRWEAFTGKKASLIKS